MHALMRGVRNRIWHRACVLAALTVTIHGAHAQSFNCAKASTAIEDAICADRALGDLDVTLARTLKEAISRVPEQQQTLIRDERLWLAHRNQRCAQPTKASLSPLIACLTNAYTERIQQLRQLRTDSVSLAYPDACVVVRDDNQARLENPSGVTPQAYETLTSPWDTPTGTPPATDFLPHLIPFDPDGDPPDIAAHNVAVDGGRAGFVTVTSSHDCSAVTNYEVWSPDLKQYRGSIADALGREPASGDHPSFVSIKGQHVLLNWGTQNGLEETDVLGFRRNLAPALICRVVLESARPEKLIFAADKDLCEAVQRDEVENVPLNDVGDQELGITDLGKLPSNFYLIDLIQSVEIYARGVVDIAHDGNLQSIAMVRSSGTAGAGCGFQNLAWEWPMVTVGDGRPDLSSPINREAVIAGNQVSRLIRYHGRIYIDGHASSGEHGNHTVAAVSKEGVNKMCEFAPFHYAIRLPEAR